MEYMAELSEKGQIAKKAAQFLANISTEEKNNTLKLMAEVLTNKAQDILDANAIDIARGQEKGLSKAFLDRLMLTQKRIHDMAEGLLQTANLKDPISEVVSTDKRPNGLEIAKIRVPLGVIGIIYESRPNVTVDAVALCLKSGNAVILRGGSEAINSNMAIVKVLTEALKESDMPEGVVQLITTTDRAAVQAMLKLNEYIDVIIPRGGAGLIKTVVKNSTVPVIETGIGVCHTYVDEFADIAMAMKIAINAKVSRPAVCNAMETLLIHKNIAKDFLPPMIEAFRKNNVELRGCNKTIKYNSYIKVAEEADWDTEYSDLILSIKIVDSLIEAVEHIKAHGTKHSEAIITENYKNARLFVKIVDAAAVYVNASTRFTDGFEFGFGAEIGISTQKMHARGPMGLNELTSMKYIIYGDGQIR